jgi:uncharacterized protein YaaQ
MMKLVVAIGEAECAARVLAALIATSYPVTKFSSWSSFRRKGNATFLIGVGAAEVEGVLQCIERACRGMPRRKNPEAGCASIFVLDVEQQIRM